MNDIKMCQMSVGLGSQYVQANTERRLFMPKVHTAQKKLHKGLTRTAVFTVKIGLAIFAAWLVSLWAIEAAYNQRGYSAVGGEWILIIGAFGYTYYKLTEHYKKLEKRRQRKNGRVRNIYY